MASTANLFLDTSALVKRFVQERGSDVMKELLTDDDFRGRLFIAQHTAPELTSALNERYRQTELSHKEVDAAVAEFADLQSIFAVVPVTPPVIDEASLILNLHRRSRIHAGDALHLGALRHASRTLLRNEPVILVTADRSMLAVAAQLGIEGFDPERHRINLLKF